MDDDRFDTLAKALADPASRRGLLRLLAGGTVAYLAAGGTGEVAAKRRRKRRKKCGPCRHRRHGRCKPKPNGTPCSTGACVNGSCAAPCLVDCTTQECGPDGCGGSCGSCPGGTCVDGTTCVCPPTRVKCDRACVDTLTDPRHCGGCAVNCAPGELCRAAECCKPIGNACDTPIDCCSNFCQVVADKGVLGCGVGATQCCQYLGLACGGDCDCCQEAVCRGGRCCLPAGAACGSSNDCCTSCDLTTFTCR